MLQQTQLLAKAGEAMSHGGAGAGGAAATAAPANPSSGAYVRPPLDFLLPPALLRLQKSLAGSRQQGRVSYNGRDEPGFSGSSVKMTPLGSPTGRHVTLA